MNTSKIGTVSRMTSTAMFELASKKMGKQWHCNNCRSDFKIRYKSSEKLLHNKRHLSWCLYCFGTSLLIAPYL